MPFSRKMSLSCLLAAQCLIAGLSVPAHAGTIPGYFFKEWTTAANCAEQNAGLAARVPSGLKFSISRDSAAPDGSYVFEAINTDSLQWEQGWNGMKLEYRAGTKMTTIPADFECIPGQESTSPFLAMSGYAVSAEPYYEPEHWYGMARIHGQLEHILVFPRDASNGGPSAVIVLQSVTSAKTVQLDDNGMINTQ
jgi:hypothetical protein